MIDGFWISTCLLIAMTVGIIYFRYSTTMLESNWPLVYYAFVVLHLQLYPEGLSQQVVFAAILAAMFIRFEFLAGWFLKTVQMIEYVLLLLIVYRLFLLIF
jgi:hypothetical protein